MLFAGAVTIKDQKKIAINKKKFLEQKQSGGVTTGGNKSLISDDSSTYNQKKWGVPKSGNGVKLSLKLMCWCRKKD